MREDWEQGNRGNTGNRNSNGEYWEQRAIKGGRGRPGLLGAHATEHTGNYQFRFCLPKCQAAPVHPLSDIMVM